MANGTTNGRAHVLEISNRAAVQKINTEDVTGIIANIENHESGLNPNAHQVANIGGLQGFLDGKSPVGHTHTISNVTSLQSTLDGKEPAFSKNTGFNKNFGSTAGTVCQGNDSRLSDARTPTAHGHTIADVSGLQVALDGKVDDFSGYSGVLTVVTSVNVGATVVTTKEVTVTNGIIVSVV